MKKHFLTFLVITPFLCFAQETEEQKSKLSLGLNFSPNICYQTYLYPGRGQRYVFQTSSSLKPAFGFNTGVSAQYQMRENLEIDFGVQFTRFAIRSKNVAVFAKNNEILGFGNTQSRYHYIDIPIRVNYRFVNKRTFVYAVLGVSMSQFLDKHSKTWSELDSGEKYIFKLNLNNTDYNSTVFNVVGGVGFGRNISDKVSLRFEPLIRHAIMPLFDFNVKHYNYSFGCQIGGYLKL